jgi:hypothetical protein
MSTHQFDNDESTRRARAVLPTSRLMEMNGHGMRDKKCPFCGKKGATLRNEKGVERFKCWRASCPSATFGENPSWDESAYLSYVSGIKDRKEAWIHWLKLANVYEEPQQRKPAPSSPHQNLSATDGSATQEREKRTAPPASSAAGEPAAEHVNATPGPDIPSDFGAAPPRVATSLELFYSWLKLRPTDTAKLLDRRGLTAETCRALGFRSGSRSNKALLEKLGETFTANQLKLDGWWRSDESENKQFCGWGIIGKKRFPDKKSEFQWGWCEPILIPYFDARGEIIHLRPHKGMIKGHSPRLYVPRASQAYRAEHPELDGAFEEKFDNVIITEGEFKAAAVWQVLGQGSFQVPTGKPVYGVCSMPGITMANNYDVRMDLEVWLEAVGAKRAIVVFDNEEKSDPKLTSYKPDYRRRFESEIWARFLAASLQKELRIEGLYSRIPDAWRDKTGKADWDGVAGAWTRGEREAFK